MDSRKPHIILLPGAWHTPAHFTSLTDLLLTHGYASTALPLQSIITTPAVSSLLPDISALDAAVSALADAGEDIIVIGHSFSGVIVTGALQGLGEKEREEQGKKGGVVKLGFMAAFCPSEGVGLLQALGRTPEWYDVQDPWVSPTSGTPTPLFYNDLSPALAAHYTSLLRPHSIATHNVGVETCSWRRIPSSYLLCEIDAALPVAAQEAMVQKCQEEGAEMQSVKVRAGHSPFLSCVEETAMWIRGLAGEEVMG